MDEMSNDYVAMKRMKIAVSAAQLQSESALLKECNSKYIVRYYGVNSSKNGNWVWTYVMLVTE